jgi:hypothetical protein
MGDVKSKWDGKEIEISLDLSPKQMIEFGG